MKRALQVWLFACGLLSGVWAQPVAAAPDAAAPAVAASAEPPEAAMTPPAQILVLLRLPPEHLRPDSGYVGPYGDGLGRNGRRRAALALAQRYGLHLASAWPMPTLAVDCYLMDVPAAQTTEHLVARLEAEPGVEWAQPLQLFQAQAQVHDDPLFALQPAAAAWQLQALHGVATGQGIRIAVIDSGVETRHPDLLGQVELNENFVADRAMVAERHGTEVAGIIAARADNHAGIVGIAPGARLLALRACWQQSERSTLCSSLTLALALDFAISHGVEVINLSLSGPQDKLLARLIDVALQRGLSVVAAVDKGRADGGFPASHAGVIRVDSDGAASTLPDAVRAPGLDVPTTGPPQRWYLVSGSSYAAAHVSGLLALLREIGRQPAQPMGVTALVRLPSGAIDACATLKHARGAGAAGCALVTATEPAVARQ